MTFLQQILICISILQFKFIANSLVFFFLTDKIYITLELCNRIETVHKPEVSINTVTLIGYRKRDRVNRI